MTPTREQFKELMTFIKNAQQKEDKINDALKVIWDDEQGQYPPFYISPWWTAVRYAFCLLFNLEFNRLGIDDELEWWLDEAPKGEAKYWIDEKEYNVSDVDAFYDYLVGQANESNKKNRRIVMGQRTNLLLQVERFGKPSEEGVCSLFRGEERSANGHGRRSARLNRVDHLQWGYRKYLPMAFLRLLSSRYFKPRKMDIFEFFTRGLDLDSLDMIERDWNKYDFNHLDECQEALSHCDNNNGAMVVVITEDTRDYYHPKYKLGFLLGPEDLESEPPFSRWVTTEEYMRHQPKYNGEYDDIFAHAFDALTILSETQHIVQLKDEE